MLRRDASPSAPLVLAQAAETKVVVAAVEENRELWRSVLIAFLVGVSTLRGENSSDFPCMLHGPSYCMVLSDTVSLYNL